MAGTKKNRNRVNIDLDSETESRLREKAVGRGMTLKPFIELCLGVLAGTAQEPPPLNIRDSEPKQQRLVPPPQDIDRNPALYKTLVGPNIFSNGRHFRVSVFNSVSYHHTLEDAKAARDAIKARNR